MPRVPPVYPAPGASAVADAIRARRGPARGLSALDGTLLQSPAYAAGWNELLGAVRSRTAAHLPADVREIIILRVAVRNRAAFEWIQHEPVARREGGVGDDILAAVRHTGVGPSSRPVQIEDLTPPKGPLSPLQAAAVQFADEVTVHVRVQDETVTRLRDLLLAKGKERAATEDAVRDALSASETTFADRAITEATATAATYNMVSRILVALDVDGRGYQPVPDPAAGASQIQSQPVSPPLAYPLNAAPTPLPRSMLRLADGQVLSTVLHKSDAAPASGTLLCINSLMTDLSMWDYVLPKLTARYNVITYDQRGHGMSAIPLQPCSLDQLADDAAAILDAYAVTSAHALIGVSQGGATALAFLARHPGRAQRVIACDTQAKAPAANTKAWDERIALARTSGNGGGMGALADVTLPRWFSALFPSTDDTTSSARPSDARHAKILGHTGAMIRATPVEGMVAGARALQGYDLISPPTRLLDVAKETATPVLLLAGANDGALPDTLRQLAADAVAAGASRWQFEVVDAAGHLPMIDQPEAWLAKVLPFLEDAP